MVQREPGCGVLTGATRLQVWGDPIAHSRSPQLHTAAYAVLGLDWTYDRRRVAEEAFDGVLAELDASWRGLSLTYPLKGRAYAASAGQHDRRAALTGAVNTLLLAGGRPQGFNTDVGGIVGALADAGVEGITHARIVGAGATATSALVALAELGVRRVEVVARRPHAVAALRPSAEAQGMEVAAASFEDPSFAPVALTIATLPGDASLDADAAARLAADGGVLLDVVYGHWPTALADAWRSAGRTALGGTGMLLHQALLQVRVFVTGDPATALPDEPKVLAAMRGALAVGD